MKLLNTNFTIFLLVLVLSALASEWALRKKGTYLSYHEQLGYKYESAYISSDNTYLTLAPGNQFCYNNDEFQVDYSVNSFGFREKEIQPDRLTQPKVFVFGDSFVEGVGADYELTWPRQLEKILKENKSDALVSIFGSSSSDPFYNLKNLSDRALTLHPTHVIFSVNSTDYKDFEIRGGMERFTRDGQVEYRKAPWFEKFFIRSHLVRLFVVELAGYDLNLLTLNHDTKGHKKATQAINTCLMEAQRLCDENNIHFIAVTHSTPYEICHPNGYISTSDDLFQQNITGVPVIHLSRPIHEELKDLNCNAYCWPVDGHFNAAGYKMFAELLNQQINLAFPDFWE
ncbi:MAG: SGNH/GDSL hydrolase family protein [Bacteroidetes bacterium]|nr:SGNH/GDSL hydrolase family protein [Bacteroidota bacterium]